MKIVIEKKIHSTKDTRTIWFYTQSGLSMKLHITLVVVDNIADCSALQLH